LLFIKNSQKIHYRTFLTYRQGESDWYGFPQVQEMIKQA